jgi:hypothetical protein
MKILGRMALTSFSTFYKLPHATPERGKWSRDVPYRQQQQYGYEMFEGSFWA